MEISIEPGLGLDILKSLSLEDRNITKMSLNIDTEIITIEMCSIENRKLSISNLEDLYNEQKN